MRHRRRRQHAQHRPDPDRGLKRLEYRGYDSCGVAVHQTAACSARAAPRASPSSQAQVEHDRPRKAAPASPTRAGPRTARRPCTTRTRTSARPGDGDAGSAPAASRWCTTASSRTTTSCAPSCRPRLRLREPDRHRGHRPPGRPPATTATCSRPCSAPCAAARRLRDRRVLPRRAAPRGRRAPGLAAGRSASAASGENFLASDAMALAGVTDRIVYLEEGDVVDLQLGKYWIVDDATAHGRVERAGARPCTRTPARPSSARTATTCRRRSSSSRARSPTRSKACTGIIARAVRRRRVPRLQGDRLGADPRLRHQLLRRLGRQVLARGASPRCRRRSRSRASTATATACPNPTHAGRHDLADRRDRRHAGRAASTRARSAWRTR